MKHINMNIVKISVQLLDEGVEVWRPTQAIDLGGGLFKVLPTDNYSPSNEKWEFVPGSIVRVVEKNLVKGMTSVKVLAAVKI